MRLVCTVHSVLNAHTPLRLLALVYSHNRYSTIKHALREPHLAAPHARAGKAAAPRAPAARARATGWRALLGWRLTVAVAVATEARIVAARVAPVASRHTRPARHAVHAVGTRRALRPVGTEDSLRAWWRGHAMRARSTGRPIGPRRPNQTQPRRPHLPLNALDARGPNGTVLPRRTGGTGCAIAAGRTRRAR
jgi:hypothetical protein